MKHSHCMECKRFGVLFVAVLLLVVASGCAKTFVGKANQGLVIDAAAYNTLTESVEEAYRQNLITDAQFDEIKTVSDKYMDAHNSMTRALAAYKRAETAGVAAESDYQKYITYAQEALQLFVELEEVADKYLSRETKEVKRQ